MQIGSSGKEFTIMIMACLFKGLQSDSSGVYYSTLFFIFTYCKILFLELVQTFSTSGMLLVCCVYIELKECESMPFGQCINSCTVAIIISGSIVALYTSLAHAYVDDMI